MSKNEYQREQFPVGTIVEAIIPIGRGPMSDPFPVGTRGKVTSHCDDGRAWVFFDDEGHTFHKIEKFVRVVCTHQNDDERCPANATSEHQPAARGGGDEWRISTAFGDAEPERAVYEGGRYLFSAPLLSWFELNQIVTKHNQHQSLVAEREQMVEALKEVEAMLNKELARDYESQLWAKKVRAVLMTSKQRSTSE